MPYEHKPRGAGDLILANDWNAIGDEVQRVAGLLEQDEKKETVSLPIPLRVFGKGAPKSPLSVAGGAAFGAAYAAKHAAPADGVIVQGSVGIGTPTPEAALEIDRGSSNQLALKLTSAGPGWGSGLQMENTSSGGRSFGIYSGGGKLHVSDVEAGEDRLVIDGAGNVGIGTSEPSHALHVRTGENVGLFESTGAQAFLRFTTKEGMANRVEVANRPGGRLALWVGGGHDALSVTRAGNVGIGTTEPAARLDVRGGDVVAGGPNGQRFIFHTRTNGGGDFLQVTTDDSAGNWQWHQGITLRRGSGNVGIGTSDPQAKLNVLHQPQDANGNALIVGPTNGSNLRLGYHSDYAWIQSHGGKPLRINPLGNRVDIGQEGWQAPEFLSGWANYGGEYNPAGCFKDSMGVVHLRGLVKNATAIAEYSKHNEPIRSAVRANLLQQFVGWGKHPLLQLPAGMRPPRRELLATIANESIVARLDINTDGKVYLVAGSFEWLSLDGLTFRAA